MANPIKASDLYQDDGALKRLIAELEQVSKAMENLKGEAVRLSVSTKKMNATQADGREEIAKASKQADELARLYEKYNDSLTQTARDIAAVKEAQTKLNQVNRAEARLAVAKEGSYNALSAQYSLLKLRLNQMTRAERDNTAEGRKMVKQAREIYEEMKRLQEETGKTSLNVGNYKESIKEALQETGLFPGVLGQLSGQLQALRGVMASLSANIGGTNKMLRGLKLALAATGIGAVVLVLGSLVAWLTKTQQGMDLVKRVIAGFNAAASVLIDRLSSVGDALRKDFIGETKKAGTAFVDFWVAVFSGDRAGVIAMLGKVGVKTKELADDVWAAAKEGYGLEGAFQAISREAATLEVRTAAARAEIKRLNLIAEDTTRGYADRAKAASAAGAIERDLLNERQGLLEKELALVKDLNSIATSNDQDLQREYDLEKEIAQVRTESLELQTTINNKLNTINAEAVRVAKKLNDELRDAAALREGAAAVALRNYEKEIEAIEELEKQYRLLGEEKVFTDSRIIAAARYQQELDKILLTTKELATQAMPTLARSSAIAGDRLEEVREIVQNTGKGTEEAGKGFELTKEGVDALKGAFSTAKANVADFFQQQQQLADLQLQQAQQGVQAAQTELQTQLQLDAQGYASRVETARAELALAKQTQAEAEKQRQKAQRAQLVAQSIEQASNLVTAISKLFAELPFFLALPASATLFGTFAAAKIKAFQATKLFSQGGYEVLDGGSHASGNDVPLYTRNGVQRRAEGGEGMAIFSRQATRKYGAALPDLVQAINRGEFERKYAALAYAAEGLNIGGPVVNVNTRGLESRLDALRADGRRKVYQDGQGRTVEVIGNRKITYV